MATETKKKRILLTTPIGTAVYPRITRPDTKFDPNGTYSTKLTVVADKATPLVAKIDELMAQSLKEAQIAENLKAKEKGIKTAKTAKQADAPYSVDEETGDVTFSFKRTAGGISKKTNEPWKASVVIVDRTATPMKDPNVGAGTQMKVSCEPSVFYIPAVGAGVKLSLVGVQIIDLVEYTGGPSAAEMGFAAEEAAAEDTDGGSEVDADEATDF